MYPSYEVIGMDKQMESLDKIKRRENKLAKEREQATAATRWLIAFGPINAFLILIPIFGNSWINTNFSGFGVSMITMRTSCFVIEVNVFCEKNFLEDQVCNHVKKFEGVHPLSRARDTFCAVPGSGQNSCQMVRTTFLTSFIIFFFFTLSAGFHMFASAFLYYYWEQKPLPQARRYAMFFFFLGPASAAVGLILWTGLTPNLNNLARSWTSSVDAATGGISIFGYDNVHSVQYGWCWFYSIVVIGLSALSMLVWPFFFVEHHKEEDAVDEEENLKDLAMNMNFDLFGNSGYGYGTAQPAYNMTQLAGTNYGHAGMQQQQGYNGMQHQNNGAMQQQQPGGQYYSSAEAYNGMSGGQVNYFGARS